MTRKGRDWTSGISRWSSALDREPGLFTVDDPRKRAGPLRHPALSSTYRMTEPSQTPMSMLNFPVNRAGRYLPQERKGMLEQAKLELRGLFSRR